MKFKSLELFNFRNFEKLNLELSPSVNVFLGDNGQGKTNLLESIHFLTRGMSFRPGNNDNFIRRTDEALARASLVKARVFSNQLENRIEMRLQSKTKQITVNQKRQGPTQLGQSFPSILFSPESLSAIKDGPEQRRNLVDEFLISHKKENQQLIQHFKRSLKSRNRLLKSYVNEAITPVEFEKTLLSLNPGFFLFATGLTRARIDALAALMPEMQEAMRFILDDQNVDISVDYLVSDQRANDWDDDQIFKALNDREQQLKPAERSMGVSLIGPHKHDIRFLFNGRDSRYYCSQGQQRALILSFKMAQIVYHYRVYKCYPVLLLDDVMSELDAAKRDRLVQLLKNTEAQIFITTTDFELSKDLQDQQLSVFKIESGMVERS